MQTSDTSALLATTASSEPSHWLTLIICEASWKRFVPPLAGAEQGQERSWSCVAQLQVMTAAPGAELRAHLQEANSWAVQQERDVAGGGR